MDDNATNAECAGMLCSVMLNNAFKAVELEIFTAVCRGKVPYDTALCEA